MLTGITEPLEFSFLFVAPALFAVQVVLAGAAYMIAHMLNIAVGLTFSGGFLDLFLFGILQGNAKTSWMRVIPVGIIYFFLYYFIFKFTIHPSFIDLFDSIYLNKLYLLHCFNILDEKFLKWRIFSKWMLLN